MKSQGEQTIEIIMPGVGGGQQGTQWFFQDQPYLRPPSSVVVGIECFTALTQTVSPLSGKTVAETTILQKSWLVLYGKPRGSEMQSEIVQRIPLLRLNVMQSLASGVTDPFARETLELNSLEIDWQKSYVGISSAPANTADRTFVFAVYYNNLK